MEQRYLVELPRRVVCKSVQQASELIELLSRHAAVEHVDSGTVEDEAAKKLGFGWHQIYRPCFSGITATELRHGQFTGDVQFMNALRDVEKEHRDTEAAIQALEAEAAE